MFKTKLKAPPQLTKNQLLDKVDKLLKSNVPDACSSLRYSSAHHSVNVSLRDRRSRLPVHASAHLLNLLNREVKKDDAKASVTTS